MSSLPGLRAHLLQFFQKLHWGESPKEHFRTKNTMALEAVVFFCIGRSVSLSVLFSCPFSLEKQGISGHFPQYFAAAVANFSARAPRTIFGTGGFFGVLGPQTRLPNEHLSPCQPRASLNTRSQETPRQWRKERQRRSGLTKWSYERNWGPQLPLVALQDPKDPSVTVFSTESDSVVFYYSVVNILRIAILYSKYSKSVQNAVIHYIFSRESLRVANSLQRVESLRVLFFCILGSLGKS